VGNIRADVRAIDGATAVAMAIAGGQDHELFIFERLGKVVEFEIRRVAHDRAVRRKVDEHPFSLLSK
jgi:hypothetical protein